MAINWTEAQIEQVVNAVIDSLGKHTPSTNGNWDSTQYNGRKFKGIFEDMNDAIAAAQAGYKAIRAMSLDEREKIIAESLQKGSRYHGKPRRYRNKNGTRRA